MVSKLHVALIPVDFVLRTPSLTHPSLKPCMQYATPTVTRQQPAQVARHYSTHGTSGCRFFQLENWEVFILRQISPSKSLQSLQVPLTHSTPFGRPLW